MTDNIFGEGFEEVKAGEFIKWTEPGQMVKGILVEVDEKPNALKNNEIQKIYTFENEDGVEFRVSSRGAAFDSAMRKIVKGQWVALKYVEDIPSKTKGNQAFKLIKVGEGQIDNNWLAKNQGDGDVKVEDIPF